MISKKLFYYLVLLLPLNLGKHFDSGTHFISGTRIDYLIPVVYVQDLLVLLILLFWFVEKGNRVFSKTASGVFNLYRAASALLVFCLFLSCLTSPVFTVSLSYFLRTGLYVFLSYYIFFEFDYQTDSISVVKMFFWSGLFVSVLGVAQYIKQGSLFGNYLFLGEQPYSAGTPGILKESLSGFTKVPPYGLFRHPNIFGGYLSLYILVLVGCLKSRRLSPFSVMVGLLVSITAFVFTFSLFSYVALLVGLAGYFFLKRLSGNRWISIGFVGLLIVLPALLPFFPVPESLRSMPSFYRRAELLSGAFKTTMSESVFGVGLGASTLYYKTNLGSDADYGFFQPVHNIFVLMLYEGGIFALFLYLILYLSVTYAGAGDRLLAALIFTSVFLGGFDHYFLTMHQMLLLFFILAGTTLSRTAQGGIKSQKL